MGGQRKAGQRMVVALQSDRSGVAYVTDNLDAVACFADAEAPTCQNLLIAAGVQLGEPLTEFELVAVNHDGSVGALFALYGIVGEAVGIDAEKIAYTGLLKFKKTSHTVMGHDVHNVLLDRTKNPLKHVVEVNANIGGYAATFVHVALPRGVVPFAA